ncbi:MAG: RNA polymerase sigma factor [Deltaproteobacteria bacterium]|nr:RNA polymerase sigma factor [Deltaproteobacteria bacterium]
MTIQIMVLAYIFMYIVDVDYQQTIKAFRQKPDPQLYETFLQNISTFIKNLLTPKISNHADREELAQEILLSIHKSLHTYDDSKAFHPWFYSVVRFKTIDHWRAAAKRKTQSLENMPDLPDHNTKSNELRLLAADVIGKMDQLSPIQYKIIYMAKVEGFSIAEIAAETGKKESAVKVTIHRVLKNIKESLT